MSYKRIGDYIKRISIKNKEDKFNRLLGININKYFMPSVANVVGTDLSKYKIVKPNQFACNRMHVGRDYRLPIAVSKEKEPFIVSPAYDVFEVIKPNELDINYLMMWFSRPEFDRNTWFYTDTDVRGKLGWDSFCDMELPIPSIEKQRQIVAEYNTVSNRIKLNEQVNQKLEETAQALYKHWFVDFEFPNEAGKPYKSSGGKLVYNEELDKDIPVGWSEVKLGEIANIFAGGDKPSKFTKTKTDEFKIPVFSNSSVNKGIFGYTDKPKVLIPSITVSARGAIIGYTVLRVEPFYPIIRLMVISSNEDVVTNYLYEVICRFNYDQSASAQGQLTSPEMKSKIILKPKKLILNSYQKLTKIIFKTIYRKEFQSHKLQDLQSLLLAKMTKVD
jgi:type I restriction enzyme S subunit